MAIGGDILEINWNHPDLGSGTIFPKSNEDSTINLGGFRSQDDENMIDGGGTMIDQMNQVRWSVDTKVAWDMQVDLTLQKLTALAKSTKLADWTITHISGAVFGGKGKPVGNLEGAGNQGTFALKLAGGGELKQQV